MVNYQNKKDGYYITSSVEPDMADRECRHLLAVHDGVLEMAGTGSIFVLRKGDVALLPRVCDTIVTNAKNGYNATHAMLKEGAFEQLCNLYCVGLYRRLVVNDRVRVFHLTPVEFGAIMDVLQLYGGISGACSAENAEMGARSLFWRMIELTGSETMGERTYPAVILHFMTAVRKEENYGKSVAELVDSGEYSMDHFTRLFKKYVGSTPIAYINSVKLMQAKKWLRTTDLPLREIASRLGFESESYFHRLFSRTLGVTPKAYRNGVIDEDE